jgi:hypothetical protein
MIKTVIKPDKTTFDMSVSLPDAYVGKEVHVFFYTDDEVIQTAASILTEKKPSDFFGTLSVEHGEKMHDYVKQNRDERELTYDSTLTHLTSQKVLQQDWLTEQENQVWEHL